MQRRHWLFFLLTGATSGCLRLTDTGSEQGGTASGEDGGTTADGGLEIRYADDDGTLQTVVESDGIASAEDPREQGDMYAVQIRLTTEAAERLVDALREVGAFEAPRDHPIFVYFSGREVQSFQLSRGLIEAMRNGSFQQDPGFTLQTDDRSFAREISNSQ
ncbi:hypothetical protein [Halobellus litoreus]|uniref:Preprotein translocase subunit SecD n=1 Tax=Halobellus litoreus TaxID=755310 RepID=A0ABD6DZ93_9EURY|nr:hypothetical protein [Halobellus litoreus]